MVVVVVYSSQVEEVVACVGKNLLFIVQPRKTFHAQNLEACVCAVTCGTATQSLPCQTSHGFPSAASSQHLNLLPEHGTQASSTAMDEPQCCPDPVKTQNFECFW